MIPNLLERMDRDNQKWNGKYLGLAMAGPSPLYLIQVRAEHEKVISCKIWLCTCEQKRVGMGKKLIPELNSPSSFLQSFLSVAETI